MVTQDQLSFHPQVLQLLPCSLQPRYRYSSRFGGGFKYWWLGDWHWDWRAHIWNHGLSLVAWRTLEKSGWWAFWLCFDGSRQLVGKWVVVPWWLWVGLFSGVLLDFINWDQKENACLVFFFFPNILVHYIYFNFPRFDYFFIPILWLCFPGFESTMVNCFFAGLNFCVWFFWFVHRVLRFLFFWVVS